MALIEVRGIEGLAGLIDREIGPGDWVPVDQRRIDLFAELSGDHQWIHVDPERAARESPYGTTIAHGNLTLSLIDGLRGELLEIGGLKLAINYGWERVRFPAPVPAGSRIRVSSKLIRLEPLEGGWWHAVTRFTVAIEGEEKPCCVADSVGRLLEGP